MGLTDLARAAQDARDLDQENERKRLASFNSNEATRVVSHLLNIPLGDIEIVSSHSINHDKDGMWGSGVIVDVTLDGDVARFRVQMQMGRTTDWDRTINRWLVLLEPDSKEPLTIKEASGSKGYNRAIWSSDSKRVTSLASLGDVLDAYRNNWDSVVASGRRIEGPQYYTEGAGDA